jgi:P27 family predicted phage terminase small subunit
MGNRNSGPRPRPTALKIFRGTTRKDRLNPDEPQLAPAPESFDTPPIELDGDDIASAYWTSNVPMLRKIGLISEAERGPLIALCQQWSRYIDAQNEIQKNGAVDFSGEHGPMMSPYVAVADKSLGHLLKLWGELGLSPSGRSRMIALVKPEPPTAGKWAGIL